MQFFPIICSWIGHANSIMMIRHIYFYYSGRTQSTSFLKICTCPEDLFRNWTSIVLVCFPLMFYIPCAVNDRMSMIWSMGHNPWRVSRGWLFCKKSQEVGVMLSHFLSTLKEFMIALLIFQWKSLSHIILTSFSNMQLPYFPEG